MTVFAGNDNIRDAWWPYGDGDLLERAMIIGYRSGFYTDDELLITFDMITQLAAKALGLEVYGIVPGAPADFVVLDARHPKKPSLLDPKTARYSSPAVMWQGRVSTAKTERPSSCSW